MERKRTATIQSFDFQWHNLTEGPYLLSDKSWRQNVSEYIVDELQISKGNISGKSVLDCGCGNGRWSYGFEKLGCRVHGFDTSLNGIEYAREHVAGRFDVANILDTKGLLSLYKEDSFDIVWCWGVLHHTGDPKKAFDNIARFVKHGGILHVYLYGKKGLGNRLLRFVFNRFDFETRVRLARMVSAINHSSVHSNFDGLSPPLASQHSESEIEEWFRSDGFTFKRVYPSWAGPSRDLFVTGVKTTHQANVA
jgi:2-polyprenyl-3-methyl-5-hydroxy-6-metoxy-1,4-benzoquinol methylase